MLKSSLRFHLCNRTFKNLEFTRSLTRRSTDTGFKRKWPTGTPHNKPTFSMSEEQAALEDWGDRQIDQSGRGRGRGRGGGRGGRGGGGGSRGAKGEMNREVAVSKALSKLLRHAAEDAGLTLDGEGFARVDQVMQWPRLKSLKVTFADIQLAVNDNAKQRFSLKPNPALSAPPDPSSSTSSDWLIRANQGHSIAAVSSAALLTPITLAAGNVPAVVVHGTFFAFYQAIIDSGGLKRMTRNHIHFSTGLPEEKDGGNGVISGMRGDAELLIYVDVKRSLADGVEWWMSENGVVLTAGSEEEGVLSSKYFTRVEGRRQDIGVLWEDGVEKGKLPAEFQGRKPPMGKGKGGRSRGARDGMGRGRGRGGGGVGESSMSIAEGA